MATTFRLDIQYRGDRFHGWQAQPDGITVQETLERSYERFLGEKVSLLGSGRTDAGVHARHQVASLRTAIPLPPKAARFGVLRYLPEGVSIFRSVEVDPDWRPRPVSYREYRYFLWKTPDPPVFYRPFSGGTFYDLHGEPMVAASRYLLGEKDFSSFRAAGCTSRTPIRRLDEIEILDREVYWEFRIRGNAFLRQMVRIIVGTLVEVGRGAIPPETVGEIVAGKDRALAGPTMPPQGLFLWRIVFPDDETPEIPPTIWERP